jgi:hypothetical protein
MNKQISTSPEKRKRKVVQSVFLQQRQEKCPENPKERQKEFEG